MKNKSLKEVDENKKQKILSEIEIIDTELAINPDDAPAKVRRGRLVRQLTEINELHSENLPLNLYSEEQHNSQEQSVNNEHSYTTELAEKEDLEKVLLKMKSDKLIYSLERKLRTEPEHWVIAEINKDPKSRSYVSSYCQGQEEAYNRILLEAEKVSCSNYKDRLREITQKIKTRNAMILKLVPKDSNVLNTRIISLSNSLNTLNVVHFINLSADENGMRDAKDKLKDTTKPLIETLKKIEQKASKYFEN